MLKRPFPKAAALVDKADLAVYMIVKEHDSFKTQDVELGRAL